MAEKGLTRPEALSFLRDILELELPQISNESRKPNKLFMNSILRAYVEHMPFQSVTLIAEDLEKRHVPSWLEIKSAMFKKYGGVCHSLNAFMFYLLKILGYDVTLGYATVTHIPNATQGTHIIIFVRNLVEADDMYLVDVGFGCPSFEAVSLDFDDESPVYRHSYLEYKFFKQNGKIIRAHGKGDPRFDKEPEPWETVLGSWRGAYVFTMESCRPFEMFDSVYKHTYTNIDGMVFQKSLRAGIYPNGKAFVILHENILSEGEGQLLEKTHLPDDEAIMKAYLKHFPQFEEETVRKAVRNWRKQLLCSSGRELIENIV